MSQSASAPDPVDTAGNSQNGANDDPLRALTAAVASLTAQIAAKDQEIHQLVAQVVAHDDAVKALRQQAAEHASQEQALRQQLQDVTAAHDALLADTDAQAAEFETMIALRDQNLTAREWELSSLRSEVIGLQQVVKTLEARLNGIYASRTWLLSKKLWSARTKARKLIR